MSSRRLETMAHLFARLATANKCYTTERLWLKTDVRAYGCGCSSGEELSSSLCWQYSPWFTSHYMPAANMLGFRAYETHSAASTSMASYSNPKQLLTNLLNLAL